MKPGLWALAMAPALLCGAGGTPARGDDARRGMVVLQFDDGTIGHYTNVFPVLQKYGLKGSFGVVTGALGRPGRLLPEHVAAMHAAGHEIHDHTLYHRARFWGEAVREDPGRAVAAWEEEIRQSLGILERLGIRTRGWNQPGGEGQLWTRALRDLLARHYDYAAGRVGLPPEQRFNVHWNMRDDPLSAGYGLQVPGSSTKTAGAPEELFRQIADGVARGLVCIPLYHVVEGEETARLERLCRFLRDNRIPVRPMAEAIEAVRNTPRYVSAGANQMPNGGFTWDLDGNGRPDGWEGVSYAAPEIAPPAKSTRAVRLSPGVPAATILYGPEPGSNELRLYLRAGPGRTAAVKLELEALTLSPEIAPAGPNEGLYTYSREVLAPSGGGQAGARWAVRTWKIAVPARADRIFVRISSAEAVYMAHPVWRRR